PPPPQTKKRLGFGQGLVAFEQEKKKVVEPSQKEESITNDNEPTTKNDESTTNNNEFATKNNESTLEKKNSDAPVESLIVEKSPQSSLSPKDPRIRSPTMAENNKPQDKPQKKSTTVSLPSKEEVLHNIERLDSEIAQIESQ